MVKFIKPFIFSSWYILVSSVYKESEQINKASLLRLQWRDSIPSKVLCTCNKHVPPNFTISVHLSACKNKTEDQWMEVNNIWYWVVLLKYFDIRGIGTLLQIGQRQRTAHTNTSMPSRVSKADAYRSVSATPDENKYKVDALVQRTFSQFSRL